MKKRILVTLRALVLGAMLGVGTLFAVTFAGNGELKDGERLAGFAEIVRDGYVSMALLDMGDGKLALIDAGNDPEAKALRAALARRGKSERDVELVLLTHGHQDHIAGLRTLTRADVLALADEAELVAGTRQNRSPISKVISHRPTGLAVTTPLRDGTSVSLGTRTLRVFAVPGHTRGSAAYYVEGLLFLGDSADASAEGKLTPAKWLFSDDTHQNQASLRRLAKRLEAEKLPVKHLVFSHTGTLPGLGPLLAFAATSGT